MRRLAACAVLLMSCLSSVATSYWVCEQGSWPIDGATNVALDARLQIHSQNEGLEVYPNLEDTLSLVVADSGEPVPFDYELDPPMVYLTPVDGLQPDTTYRLEGLRLTEVESAHYTTPYLAATPANVTFSTGGEPTLLGWGNDGAQLWVVYSEPVDEPQLTVDGVLQGGMEALDEHLWTAAWSPDAQSVVVDGHELIDSTSLRWIELNTAQGGGTCML